MGVNKLISSNRVQSATRRDQTNRKTDAYIYGEGNPLFSTKKQGQILIDEKTGQFIGHAATLQPLQPSAYHEEHQSISALSGKHL